ncbi:MAG: C45 family autoproteolytic acyltransferase/hydrolase [Thermoplasmata archaeon]
MAKARLKIVEVSGSYENMGSRAGSACKREVRDMLADARGSVERRRLTWEKARAAAAKHLPFVEDYSKDQVNYVRGFAKGSGVPFEDLFLLFCLDEKGMCTDIMVNGDATADGGVYSAHSEDWTESSERQLVLLKAKPRGKPSAMVMTMGGLEWIIGLNSAGLTLTGNSLYQNDIRVGVPKLFVAPQVLASKTPGEALSAATPAHRASSYNNNITHSSGEMYCVEGTATDFAVLYPDDGYLVHANHYLHPRLMKYETAFGGEGIRTIEGASSTVVRYHRALRLIRSQLGDVTKESLMGILTDHVNRPGSICRHVRKEDPPHERTKTTFAVVLDPVKLKMHLCIGNPCEGEFKEHALR